MFMKALVLKANGKMEFTDVPLAGRPGNDWILVRVAYAGICNSDIKRGFGGGAYHYPLIMGHEFSGTVVESFAGSSFTTGDRVVVYPLLPCHGCTSCQTGDYTQCLHYDYLGSRRDGGFCEYVWVPQENLVPVPDHVDLLHAALTEPCSVALHGINHLAVHPGDTTVVIGFGTLGNMVAQWLAIRGCSSILVVDIDEYKIEQARNMGFVPVNARGKDPPTSVFQQTGGRGADLVAEACGLPGTFVQAIQSAGRSAQILFLGNIRGQFVIGEKDFSTILRKELKIFGTWNSSIVPRGNNEWTTVLAHMDRKIQIAPLISHTLELREGPQVFKQIADGSFGSFGRIIFRIHP
jgi:L-iditol 2-dehydrogenase/galactitol-1-phosphate 5-dehydrogenase